MLTSYVDAKKKKKKKIQGRAIAIDDHLANWFLLPTFKKQ